MRGALDLTDSSKKVTYLRTKALFSQLLPADLDYLAALFPCAHFVISFRHNLISRSRRTCHFTKENRTLRNSSGIRLNSSWYGLGSTRNDSFHSCSRTFPCPLSTGFSLSRLRPPVVQLYESAPRKQQWRVSRSQFQGKQRHMYQVTCVSQRLFVHSLNSSSKLMRLMRHPCSLG